MLRNRKFFQGTVMLIFIRKHTQELLLTDLYSMKLSNKCRKKLKSYAERNKHHSRGFDGETEQDKVPDISDGKDLEKEATDREWVRDAFAVLTDEERYIVNSFLLAGYRGEEIAENLGIGASTLRSKYRRALMKMRKKLDP